jgi:3-hydroxybutyryl-CoA dehydrogenase
MSDPRVLVIGAGTMGHGIAHVAAQCGCEARLYDVNADAVAAGLAKVKANLQKGVDRGKVTEEDRDATLSRLGAASSELSEAARTSDLVIEAVPEDLSLKQKIFKTLDANAPEGAILASNTSSLSLTKIADATNRPDRVIGLHFFNPVHLMKLLEIVKTEETSEETLSFCRDLGDRMGKTSIVVNDSPGFATSRLGLALGLEAIRMVEEGVASPQDIDTAMELGYRHPMGPLKLTDLVGLDVRLGIADHLALTLDDHRFLAPQLLRDMVAEGKLGKKSGHGFYDWA